MKKQLSPKLDIVFKMIFGEEKNKNLTKELLQDVLQEKIDTIELDKNTNLYPEQFDEKTGIVDIKAVINEKNPVDIEMQIVDNKDIEKRILFYWSKLYLKQLKQGDIYDKLNRTISIVFLDYEIEKLRNLPIRTKWQIMDETGQKVVLTNDLEIYIIELPKIRKQKIKEDELTKWILFLENPYGKEVEEKMEQDEAIKEARRVLDDINSDEAKIRMAELREKYIMDKASELATAEEKGIKKGIKEGIKKTAKKMKQENIEIDLICKITDLSKEEIENL